MVPRVHFVEEEEEEEEEKEEEEEEEDSVEEEEKEEAVALTTDFIPAWSTALGSAMAGANFNTSAKRELACSVISNISRASACVGFSVAL